MTTASYNNLNQLLTRGGKTRFQGTINEPGHVTVAGQAAWMQGATNFTADVPLASGTNNVAIVARDASDNTRTNTYQVITPEPQSLTYDVAGNMVSDGTRTYAWDARSRLVKITHADASTSEFTYDALGRRVLIVEKDSAGTVNETRRFIYDGLEEAELRDADNNVIRRYYPEGWRDEPTAANYFLTKDHLGSTREVVDGSGTLATRYTYDAYGRTTQLVGTVESDNLYTGHYRHEKSGLYLTMYRAYSPELGRWLSRDPIGEAGGINLYGYVLNDPINWVDPLGLVTVGIGLKGSASVFLGLDLGGAVTLSISGWNPLDWRAGVSATGSGSLGTGYGGWLGLNFMIAPFASCPEQLNGWSGGVGGSVSLAGAVGAVDVGGLTLKNISGENPEAWVINANLGVGGEITGPPNAVSAEGHVSWGLTGGGSVSPRELFNEVFKR